jgi:TonB family protein
MMKLWLDTHAKSTTLTPSVVLSIIVHTVLIGAAVAATVDAGTEDKQLPANSIVRFLAPPDRPAGQLPQREMVRFVALAVPASGSGVTPQTVETSKAHDKISGIDERDALPLPELHGEDSVFSVVEVDSAATRYEWSAAPAYPPRMLERNTEGSVRAEFVVGQDGYADTISLTILVSTHPDFTKAVRDALPFMRFRPAKIGGASVNQLVQQEFQFRITKAAADSQRPRKPIP